MKIPLFAQAWEGDQYAVRIGISFQMGSKVNRVGLLGGAYQRVGQWQLNGLWRGYFNWNSYGPSGKRFEHQFAAAMLFGFGNSSAVREQAWTALNDQLGRQYSLGYVVRWYLDRFTPQWSAGWAVRLGDVELLLENDAFIFGGKDRFRTGALEVAYWLNETRVGTQVLLWTGDPQHPSCRKIEKSTSYPCRFGYRDLSNSLLGIYSHGILSLKVGHAIWNDQWAELQLGLDSEKIRHFFQNKLIHDGLSIFQPLNGPENPHLPMLTPDGRPYLFQENQQIRKNRFWYAFGWNNETHY
ncbi:MAG: polymorphic toxin type 23 domain-containing protein [Bacteroidota bacterium]